MNNDVLKEVLRIQRSLSARGEGSKYLPSEVRRQAEANVRNQSAQRSSNRRSSGNNTRGWYR